jgi:hypothetical protein
VEALCPEFDAVSVEEGAFVVGWGRRPVAVTFPIIVGHLQKEDTRLSADCWTFFSAARQRGEEADLVI